MALLKDRDLLAYHKKDRSIVMDEQSCMLGEIPICSEVFPRTLCVPPEVFLAVLFL